MIGELQTIRRDFPLGRFEIGIEETRLDLAQYQDFLQREAEGIATFRQHQQAAFDAERQRWIASGQANFESEESTAIVQEDQPLQAGQLAVDAPIAGNLWQVKVSPGQRVAQGELLMILESMKMEINIAAPEAGIVAEVRVQPGSPVRAGQCVLVMEHTPQEAA